MIAALCVALKLGAGAVALGITVVVYSALVVAARADQHAEWMRREMGGGE